MASGKKISTEGGRELGHNPFGALSGAGLPAIASGRGADLLRPSALGTKGAQQVCAPTPEKSSAAKSRGRVDLRRETGNRGGKTVTIVDGFIGIGLPEKEALAKKMRAACGCGGTNRKSTRLNSSHSDRSRMPSSA